MIVVSDWNEYRQAMNSAGKIMMLFSGRGENAWSLITISLSVMALFVAVLNDFIYTNSELIILAEIGARFSFWS